ncbi:MAG: sulfatase [Chloroflexi bacterium]|nr:sulfatase [Chloroflexota bacterium]
MNILYLHTHDTGRFIQPYGYASPTPNLMALAQEGTLFRQCFDAAPTCSPSRAALLTGMNPHACGMLGLAHRGFGLADPSLHLAGHLRRHGYETVLCGIQHEIAAGLAGELGYERMLHADATPGAPAAASPHEQARRMMDRDLANARRVADYLREPRPRPFFLSFGMFSTHRPFPLPDEEINPDYVQPPPPLPDDPATRLDMAGFYTMARCADACVGIVLDALAASGLADDTFVFFTTDHGIAFPKMKCHLYDAGIGVALIIRFPGNRRAAQAVDALVSHLDIFPTLCEVAGAPKTERLEGKSLLPLLRGEVEQVRDEIFAEVTYHAAYEPMRCIRTPRYKYIRYFDDFDRVVKPNIDDGYSKQLLLRRGLAEARHDPAKMLFDLVFDPSERDNLAGRPEFASEQRDLAARLERWMQETNDPLLRGYAPKPAVARVNLKTALHPNEQEFES